MQDYGTADIKFGEDGLTTQAFDAYYASITTIVVDEHWRFFLEDPFKVVVGGEVVFRLENGRSTPKTYVLARYWGNGTPDVFGASGIVETDFVEPAQAHALAVDKQGRILVGGHVTVSNELALVSQPEQETGLQRGFSDN